MTQLYKLTGQMAELQAMADTDDEGLKEALQDTMDAIQGEFEVKADNIVMLRRNIESDIDAIDKEVERLNELKRMKKNSVSQISDYLRRNMEDADIKSIKRPLFTITLALAPEKVIVDKEDEIPDDFIETKTVFAPNKKSIAAKLKEIRDHNEAVRKRMAAGDDAEHELLPEPIWLTWNAVKARSESSEARMTSNHSTIVEAHRPVSDALSAKVAQFLAAGGQITQGESPAINPLPPTRSE